MKKEKLLIYIENISQLSADMRFMVNNDNLDLQVKIESIENWLKDIKKELKKGKNKNERN